MFTIHVHSLCHRDTKMKTLCQAWDNQTTVFVIDMRIDDWEGTKKKDHKDTQPVVRNTAREKMAGLLALLGRGCFIQIYGQYLCLIPELLHSYFLKGGSKNLPLIPQQRIVCSTIHCFNPTCFYNMLALKLQYPCFPIDRKINK